MPTKILIADDHQILRSGLRSLLEKLPDVEVVAEAGEGHTALELACKLQPDIIIMDISMPDLNGMDATCRIVDKVTNVKIIALSVHSDKQFIKEMLKAGASGYLLKDCAFDELEQAIQTVVKEGKIYLSPKIAGKVVRDYVKFVQKEDTEEKPNLTERERDVLQLLAEGHNTKQVGLKLSISPKTVETHRQHIMEKLEIYTLPELVKYAIRRGMTSV